MHCNDHDIIALRSMHNPQNAGTIFCDCLYRIASGRGGVDQARSNPALTAASIQFIVMSRMLIASRACLVKRIIPRQPWRSAIFGSWRAVDQTGIVLDVLAQRRRDTPAAQRMLPRDAAPAAEEADATATCHDH